MTLARQLIERCRHPVSQKARDAARRHVLDWAGCVYGAAHEPLAKKLRRSLAGTDGAFPSFGLGPRAYDAALTYSSALGNILEMDDLARSALLHPGPVIVPAALYSGLCSDVSYGEVLDAMVAGYEAATRLGRSLDAFHYARWHPTTTVGMAAAAVAAAQVAKLDAEQSLSAFANALSVSGGLWHMRHHDVTTKQWHSVHAVRTGIAAADAAALGFTGSAEAIEGSQGWHAVLAETPNPDAITAESDWLIHTMSFKPWPACRHCHPVIDATRMARDELDPAAIAALHVETYRDALVFCDRPHPTTSGEARFSLQHCVAVALAGESITPADFEPENLDTATRRDVRNTVTVAEDSGFTAAYPEHFGARITVTARDGSSRQFTVPDAMGDPEWPLEDTALRTKFDMLADWGVGSAEVTHALAEAVLQAPADTPIAEVLRSAP